MTAPLRLHSTSRSLTFAIAVFLTFAGLVAVSTSAQAAPNKSLKTINLCITKSGTEKGKVRFAPSKHCKKGEQRIQVMANSAQQGVLGVEESSGKKGVAGDKGPTGDKGPEGDRGISGMLLSGFSTSSASSTSNPSYLGPFLTSASSTTEANVQQILPVGGTIANLTVKLGSGPGSGSSSWTFTVRKNGVATAASCAVTSSSPAPTCTSAGTVTFVAGDLISLQASPNGDPSGWGSIRWGVTLAAN